ncbi:MAG: hypothetical protein N5P05_003091 [Chroococcopsis gigantea SAG 12.99]|jgi:hypothetical protein|nr:hypothetical protein [Chroococcopsis gigantea SAG 12.99]
MGRSVVEVEKTFYLFSPKVETTGDYAKRVLGIG